MGDGAKANKIEYCYNVGSLNVSGATKGIDGGISTCAVSCKYCYNVCSISKGYGICPKGSGATNCYYVSTKESSVGAAKTTTVMQSSSTVVLLNALLTLLQPVRFHPCL